MEPSNTDIAVIRDVKGYYTDTIGIFKREQLTGMDLKFRRTLRTNQGDVDEYEIVRH